MNLLVNIVFVIAGTCLLIGLSFMLLDGVCLNSGLIGAIRDYFKDKRNREFGERMRRATGHGLSDRYDLHLLERRIAELENKKKSKKK